MNEWFRLAASALWIIGCALGLAVLSYASWQAATRRQKFTRLLSTRSHTALLDLSGLLISLGLGGTASSRWEQAAWGLLGLAFVYQIWATLRRKDQST
jgi:dolichyl-phosphate-mannose--protein O-mannosyl transferase